MKTFHHLSGLLLKHVKQHNQLADLRWIRVCLAQQKVQLLLHLSGLLPQRLQSRQHLRQKRSHLLHLPRCEAQKRSNNRRRRWTWRTYVGSSRNRDGSSHHLRREKQHCCKQRNETDFFHDRYLLHSKTKTPPPRGLFTTEESFGIDCLDIRKAGPTLDSSFVHEKAVPDFSGTAFPARKIRVARSPIRLL